MPLQQINLHDKDASSEFKPTPEEMRTIVEKMKDPEFARLWSDYVKDLQDPKYREEEEAYLRQVEQEAREGGDASFDFVFPKAGFVVELCEADGPTFVNMCHSDKIDEFREEATGDRMASRWHVPVSVGRAREEDHNGGRVTVFDAVFHPKTLGLADRSDRFMCFLVEIAVENINAGYQRAFGFGFRRHASPVALGTPANQTIKREKGKPSPFAATEEPPSAAPVRPVTRTTAANTANAKEVATPGAGRGEGRGGEGLRAAKQPEPASTVPTHTIIHRGEIDLTDAWNWKVSDKRVGVPRELVVRVDFPGVTSAAHLDVDVAPTHLQINPSPAHHAFHGAIVLPFSVDETPVSAKFDKAKQALTLTLRVLPPELPAQQQVARLEERDGDARDPDSATTHVEQEQDQEQEAVPMADAPSSTTATDATAERAAMLLRSPEHVAAPQSTAVASQDDGDARYQAMMNKILETRREREAAEAAEAAATTEQPNDSPAASIPPAAAAAPASGEAEPVEVIDLRGKQQAWLSGVQQAAATERGDSAGTDESEIQSSQRHARVLVDPQLRAEEEERDAEMKRRLKEARRQQEREREAERVEALLRAKMAELPLASSLIFEIE